MTAVRLDEQTAVVPQMLIYAKKRSLYTELASALDHTKVSDRNATYVLPDAAKSLGQDRVSLC